MIRKLRDRASFRALAIAMLLAAAGMTLIGAAVESTTARADESTPLKIGLLLDLSSGSAEVYRDRRRAFELAIKHVNEGGGVFGQPVTVAVGDATSGPEKAVAAARRLVEVEGVHAIVGPNASVSALPVAERVSGPAAIPTVSFSATSPALTAAADNDFFFRTALSDVSQGPVLAGLTRERGFDNVGLLYVDDPWGRGLARAFDAAWDGPLRAVPVDRDRTGFLAALRESAGGGAQALVVIAFEAAALAMVREAIDDGLYDRFVFGDAAKRVSLVRSLGGARLGNMYGTGPASAPESAASAAWEAAWVAAYGVLPVLAYVKEAYDATVALALAAQAAGRVDGAAIRDRLRAVGSAPAPSRLPARRASPMLFAFSPTAGRSTTKAPRAAWTGTRTAICAAAISASGVSPRTKGSRRSGQWRSGNEVAGPLQATLDARRDGHESAPAHRC